MQQTIQGDRPATGENCREILLDLNFSRGLGVTLFHSNSSHGRIAGILDSEGNVSYETGVRNYVWDIAQWGCTHDLVREGKFTRTGSVIEYRDAGKTVRFDTLGTGCMTLGIKGSEEYTRGADGEIRERTEISENWPHILLGSGVGQNISPDAKNLFMEVDYTVTKCFDPVDRTRYPVDPEKNAAQYQWFITLQDIDPMSESYGQSMWFGFSMFDTRNRGGTPGGMCAYDGGKEDSTGLFIYMFSLEEAAEYAENVVELPSSVVGERRRVKVDILPFIRKGLSIAKSYGALKGAHLGALKVGSTNIGWELPGNYDVEVALHYLNMYEMY